MMKRWILMPLIALSVTGSLVAAHRFTTSALADEATEAVTEATTEAGLAINHVVLFDLKSTATEAEVARMLADGETLLSEIPGVLEVEVGLKARDEREQHLKDYDLALYVKFADEAALETYGPHANHQTFIERSTPIVERFQVIDFYGE